MISESSPRSGQPNPDFMKQIGGKRLPSNPAPGSRFLQHRAESIVEEGILFIVALRSGGDDP